MENLDLNAYGVQEMNHQEMVETDGGGLLTAFLIGGAVALLLTSCGSKGSHGSENNVKVVVVDGSHNNVTINSDTTRSNK